MTKKKFIATGVVSVALFAMLSLTGCGCWSREAAVPPAPNMKESGGMCASSPYDKSPSSKKCMRSYRTASKSAKNQGVQI